jgi:uncharacterized membrane protein
MNIVSEKNYRALFRIGILVKAIDGAIETIGGLFIYFIQYPLVTSTLFSVFHGEIAENPHDAFWGYLLGIWHALYLSRHSFWGLLFLVHGITKFLLSIALLKNYLWAYPTAAIIFTIFVGYELYSLANQPSLFLGLITAFDTIVVGLILHEYQQIKKSPRA